jgi:hypothetical protein
MVGFAVEFALVVATFAILWRRQARERQRAREQAAQLDFDFERQRNRGA